jgi:hypothetical protein
LEKKGRLNIFSFPGNAPLNVVDLHGLNAYIVKCDGFFGHSYLIIGNPENEANPFVQFDFHSDHWIHKNAGSTVDSFMASIHAAASDAGCIVETQLPQNGLASLLQDIRNSGSLPNVVAFAIGNPEDEKRLVDAIREQITCPPRYSLILRSQCHTRAQDWFDMYKAGGSWQWTSSIVGDLPENANWPGHYWITPNAGAPTLPFAR